MQPLTYRLTLQTIIVKKKLLLWASKNHQDKAGDADITLYTVAMDARKMFGNSKLRELYKQRWNNSYKTSELVAEEIKQQEKAKRELCKEKAAKSRKREEAIESGGLLIDLAFFDGVDVKDVLQSMVE